MKKYESRKIVIDVENVMGIVHETDSYDGYRVNIEARGYRQEKEYTPEYNRLMKSYGQDEADHILAVINGEV